MAAFSVIDLDLGKATPLLVIAGAGVGAFFLVRYLSQQNAAQSQANTMNSAGDATSQYLNTVEQEAELSQILGDPGSAGDTGSSVATGVTYSGGPQNVASAPTSGTIASDTGAGSSLGNAAPSWLVGTGGSGTQPYLTSGGKVWG